MARGRDAIESELDRLCPVVQDGVFIPHLDSQVPDCSFDGFAYYMERKHELLGTRHCLSCPECGRRMRRTGEQDLVRPARLYDRKCWCPNCGGTCWYNEERNSIC